MKIAFVWACAALFFLGAAPNDAPLAIPMEWRGSINRISASSLKGHVSFLASDLLEGRGTPSQGQDIATEYIAAHFRRMGLEPRGTNGYFQETDYQVAVAPTEGVSLEIARIKVDPATVRAYSRQPVDLTEAEGVIWGKGTKVREGGVAILVPNSKAEAENMMAPVMGFMRGAMESKASALIVVDPTGGVQASMGTPRPYKGEWKGSSTSAIVFVRSQDLATALAGKEGESVTVNLKAPVVGIRKFKMRNVVGVLPGSDPVLRDTYVMISAHHDHIGSGPAEASGDRVFNGANDDASGTASVLEIAEAISKMPIHPKRSIAFVTFAGEELGLFGSRDFAESGPIPADRIVSDLNLEVTGRSDAENAKAGTVTVTGYAYTTLSQVLEEAGQLTNVKISGEPSYTENFFARSDNISLAKKGVPAITISSGYIYPDYHGKGDEWPKLDYPQMESLARMVTASVLLIADAPHPPAWTNAEGAQEYRKARPKK
jgi:hypothetical protein